MAALNSGAKCGLNEVDLFMATECSIKSNIYVGASVNENRSTKCS